VAAAATDPGFLVSSDAAISDLRIEFGFAAPDASDEIQADSSELRKRVKRSP
jgi:hypothetical protein